MQDPIQRRPSDDEQDEWIPNIEHEDLVFEEQEKEMDKINNYFDMQNENHWEDRKSGE